MTHVFRASRDGRERYSVASMYRYEDLREVHLELTSRCNASCPQCPRNLSGGDVNPALPMSELSLGDIQKILPLPFLRQLRKVYACGNYGDAMVAKDTLPIFQHLREASPTLELAMFTNGSGRTRDFWKSLATMTSYVRFSIDGLENTNHIYRRGTSWSRIMESVEAFVSAGGRAEWDFIVFRHNEHQVDEARALAKRLGFQRFFAKKTSRFSSLASAKETARQVKDRGGGPAYVIEEPLSEEWRNPEVVRLRGRSDLGAYRRETQIACKAVRHHRLYVSAEGLVFPCCWTGALYPPGRPAGTAPVWSLIEKLPKGRESLDGRLVSIRDIVDGPFFQELVPQGWEPGALPRLEPCVRACGEHDVHSAQYGASLL
jgi:MoaA/NifB/PqqE/SkfB family radical SAM enzyme